MFFVNVRIQKMDGDSTFTLPLYSFCHFSSFSFFFLVLLFTCIISTAKTGEEVLFIPEICYLYSAISSRL